MVLLLSALQAGVAVGSDHVTAGRDAPTRGDAVHESTYLPVADAHVRSDSPATNFGSSRELIVEGRPVSNVFLRFRPRGVGSIVQARLRLFVVRKPGKLLIHRTNGHAWSERKLTFRKAPRLGPPAGFPEAARTGWLEFDVTALVRLNRPVTIALTRTSSKKLAIASRESQDHAPRLVIETERRSAPVIAAAGDVACATSDSHYNGGLGTPRHCRMQATYEVLQTMSPDAILGLGDNQNSLGTLEEFMASYDRTWGRLKPLIRPAPGNWEYRVPGATGYFQYYGAAAGDPAKGYYSFDLGSWHLIALNSNCRAIGGCDLDSPQAQWLRADLAASQARCTLVYNHHPRFSSSTGGDFVQIDALWRLLADNGVELLLSGGSHFYERFVPLNAESGRDDERGVRQFVVGTGGHSSAGVGSPRPTSVVRDADTFGVLRLSLRPDGFDWRFIPEAGQPFTDRGSAACH